MPDELTRGHKAVFVVLDGIALGWSFASVEWLVSGKPWPYAIAFVILALLFALAAHNWASVKQMLNRRSSGIVSAIESFFDDYRYRVGSLFALAFLIGLTFLLYIWSIDQDLDMYVIPRVVTAKQAAALRDYLSKGPPHSVTVKVNPLDQEALEYAAGIFSALRATSWDTEMSTSDSDPNTLNAGLCIDETVDYSKPVNPKNDPLQTLEQAFQNAKITVNCGGGSGRADENKIFVVVGHRPLKLVNGPPMLFRLGRWISSL